ncbi:MAG TPA: helix-turn-helix transcriptional regulator [Candidatus Polarisedimenticolaceae bacterium]|nr:helix-turn-helix transcriptional regulator [Candidatus Polarisedimenticolaceae bacterium]
MAGLLRDRRRQLGLSLRDVEERSRAFGRPIPFTTLGKVEQGRVDPGVKRLHLLMRLYHMPLELAGDVLDLEEYAALLPPEIPRERLLDEAVAHWQKGDLQKGLAHLFAFRSHASQMQDRLLRQKALLTFAITAGSLGKYRMSREIIDNLLVAPPEPPLLVPVLVQAAVCWHWLGSGEAALGFLNRAEAHLGSHEAKQRAWVHHERASVYLSMKQFDPAREELGHAIVAYRAAGDPYGEGRALGVAGRLEFEGGNMRAALAATRVAFEHCARHGFKRLCTMRRLDEGRALVACGDTGAGLATLSETLQEAIGTDDDVVRFHAHHALWKTYGLLGDSARAELELKGAEYYVRFVDETVPEAAEIRSRLREARTVRLRTARPRRQIAATVQ